MTGQQLPAANSLPPVKCDVPGCGGTKPVSMVFTGSAFMVQASNRRVARWFCSPGCVSRWAIVQELRS